MTMWRKGIAEWIANDTAYLSCPFTWLLPVAASRCAWLKSEGYTVRAGGPAVSLRPSYLKDYAEIGGHVNALPHHNPDATVTSRGCIRQCSFCAVPSTEGALVELTEWQPKPIVCDNNILATSRKHFDRVIDRLKPVPQVDFNQGLDARLLTTYHADRLAELDLKLARLAWDHIDEASIVMDAIANLNRAGIPKSRISVYVLIGFEDTPEGALYRLGTLKALGVGMLAMRYQPLWVLRKNEYIAPGWTEAELQRYCRYWNRQSWLRSIPFEDYDPGAAAKAKAARRQP